MSPALERELVRRAIHEVTRRGKLDFYAQAANRDSFVDLMADHIRELRRRGVTASLYAQVRTNAENLGQHEELAQLFQRYEQLLTDNSLMDSEGRIWAACDAMKDDAASPMNLALVVVDGFSDFTAAQNELLRCLSHRTSRLSIALPSDDPSARPSRGKGDRLNGPHLSSRPELFAKSTATLVTLRSIFPQLSERHFARQPTHWSALDHLRDHLFQPRRQAPTASAEVIQSLSRLECIEAAGAQDEVVQIARRIKRLLITPLPFREGKGEGSTTPVPTGERPRKGSARPGDILVVFRSLADAAPRVREVFQQFGIPHFVETGQPLSATPVFKTIVSLLRLQDEDWPFRRMVTVLTNNTLLAIDDESRRAADWLVRDLQIAEGSMGLLERARHLAASTSARESSEHARRRTDPRSSCCAMPSTNCPMKRRRRNGRQR
jgi:ATP-dependent helicase/DNAse subunit B